MIKTKKIAGLAMAAMIGLGTIGTAQAAPFAAVGPNASPAVASGIETVADRDGGRRHRDGHRGERRGHRGGHRDRRHGFRGRHWVRPACFHKRIRVYDPYHDAFFIKTRLVCPRHY